jgi:hypothetical protein
VNRGVHEHGSKKRRKHREISLKKIGSLSKLLMITLNREDPDPELEQIVGYNLVLTG